MAKKLAKITEKKNGSGANLGCEATLWAVADKLRDSLDSAEYKHVVLSLIFLKYISGAFTELTNRDEVRKTGLYWLIGPEPQQAVQDRVYIGERDNVQTQLSRHDKEERMVFWTRTVVVFSKDANRTNATGFKKDCQLGL